jgi:hypothetical protein
LINTLQCGPGLPRRIYILPVIFANGTIGRRHNRRIILNAAGSANVRLHTIVILRK